MFVSHKSLNGLHMTTAFYLRGEERKRRCLEEEEARVGTETAITAYGIPLAPFSLFKYIGQILTEADDYCAALVSNMGESSRK